MRRRHDALIGHTLRNGLPLSDAHDIDFSHCRRRRRRVGRQRSKGRPQSGVRVGHANARAQCAVLKRHCVARIDAARREQRLNAAAIVVTAQHGILAQGRDFQPVERRRSGVGAVHGEIGQIGSVNLQFSTIAIVVAQARRPIVRIDGAAGTCTAVTTTTTTTRSVFEFVAPENG